MSEIREAAAAVRDAFDTPYGLVSKRIATDGVDIFIEHGWGDLRRARDGRVPIREVVSDHLRCLTWEEGDVRSRVVEAFAGVMAMRRDGVC
ncbi:hypothetical protein [Streptomyces zinciresistens]|nr:hypothetical protein [Streptomyces zinciresistens]